MTGVFDDGVRLPAGAGYQFLKDGCRRGGDGVFVAKGGEEGLLKFKQGFPSLPICGCCGVRATEYASTGTSRGRMHTRLVNSLPLRRKRVLLRPPSLEMEDAKSGPDCALIR
jgi:hypothetical protein